MMKWKNSKASMDLNRTKTRVNLKFYLKNRKDNYETNSQF